MKDKAVTKGWESLPGHLHNISYNDIIDALQITAKAKEEEMIELIRKKFPYYMVKHIAHDLGLKWQKMENR